MIDETQGIKIAGLTKRFADVSAVDGLRFDVAPGEVFGLVGPDGAGKTTTLRMLAGVLAPDAGSATVAGCDVVHEPERAKNYLSYMPQRFGLYEDLTVDENIRFYADLFSVRKSEREEQSERLLHAAGLSEFRQRLAGKLSGGMKQKLGLVCALIHRPKALLLDEPTTGVDPISRRDFWKILYDMALAGTAILTSTAYLDEAERCHRVALLHHGRLLFCDAPSHLKQQFKHGVLAITSPEPRRVRDLLQNAEGISTMVMTGDGVHVIIDDPQRRKPEFEARMKESHVAYDDIAATLPSIEDIFVESVTALGAEK